MENTSFLDRISPLLFLPDANSLDGFASTLIEYGIPEADIPDYLTDMGQLLLSASLDAQKDKGNTERLDLFRVCKRKDDLRCQVGHIKSNLESRIKIEVSERDSSPSPLGNSLNAFMRNVKATTLIVDKQFLTIKTSKTRGKLSIDSTESMDSLDLSEFARDVVHANLGLCDDFYYANESVPDTDIYGTGFFIDHNKVVTAAHVLLEASRYGVDPKNLLFIRGYFAYQTGTLPIEVYEDQLYVLDEDQVFVSEQMRNGTARGDMAWVKVKPYVTGKAFAFEWNQIASSPNTKPKSMYALGHGLGVPMKLSFGGKLQDKTYNGTPDIFTCDMKILPGNSGSPVFDANTHELVGIVSGLHEIYTKVDLDDNCVKFVTSMRGKFSCVLTHIAPFSSLKKH